MIRSVFRKHTDLYNLYYNIESTDSQFSSFLNSSKAFRLNSSLPRPERKPLYFQLKFIRVLQKRVFDPVVS
jgi:hypothetical protein